MDSNSIAFYIGICVGVWFAGCIVMSLYLYRLYQSNNTLIMTRDEKITFIIACLAWPVSLGVMLSDWSDK